MIVARLDVADAQLTVLGVERRAGCTRPGEEALHLVRVVNEPRLFQNANRSGETGKVAYVAAVARLLLFEIGCETRRST